MCGSETRPSVLWDNLLALRPKTLDDAQVALFIRKLPRHISAQINTKSFDTPKDMIRRCNQLWATQTPEEAAAASVAAAAATAGPWQHSSLRSSQHRRSPSPGRRKTPGGDKAADPPARRRRSPTPGAAKGGRNDGLCFYHARFGNKAHKCEWGIIVHVTVEAGNTVGTDGAPPQVPPKLCGGRLRG
jgi:hypothetical protein